MLAVFMGGGALSARACEMALLLAVDVSGSVDAAEYNTQMVGLAEALRDPIVSEAIVIGQSELMLIQWTGSSRQVAALTWTRISDFAALNQFAERVESEPRAWRNYSTAIGEALAYSLEFFEDVQHCRRRLIDLSGDGPSNEGAPPETKHSALLSAGITVNALAIEESEPNLTDYFREKVIVGTGAFVETAVTFADYPEKIRRKLRREVAQLTAALPMKDRVEKFARQSMSQ